MYNRLSANSAYFVVALSLLTDTLQRPLGEWMAMEARRVERRVAEDHEGIAQIVHKGGKDHNVVFRLDDVVAQ